jgi:hypothetical protein
MYFKISLRVLQNGYKNTVLKEVENNPFLGLSKYNDLRWKHHINNIGKKASATLGFIRRNVQLNVVKPPMSH